MNKDTQFLNALMLVLEKEPHIMSNHREDISKTYLIPHIITARDNMLELYSNHELKVIAWNVIDCERYSQSPRG